MNTVAQSNDELYKHLVFYSLRKLDTQSEKNRQTTKEKGSWKSAQENVKEYMRIKRKS